MPVPIPYSSLACYLNPVPRALFPGFGGEAQNVVACEQALCLGKKIVPHSTKGLFTG